MSKSSVAFCPSFLVTITLKVEGVETLNLAVFLVFMGYKYGVNVKKI